MASLFTPPYFDVGAGITPSDGALLNFYVVGSGTRKNTFTTAAATAGTEHANPVVADSKGVFPQIYLSGNYDWVLQDKNNVQKNTGSVSEFALASSLNTNTVLYFLTQVAAVASTTLIVGDLVQTLGYTTAGDIGAALYEVVAAGTGTVDGGSFINSNPGGTFQLRLLDTDGNVRKWGAVADHVTDDSVAVKGAADYQTEIFFPDGVYKISTVAFNDGQIIRGSGMGTSGTSIFPTQGADCFVIASDYTTITNLEFRDYDLVNRSDETTLEANCIMVDAVTYNANFKRLVQGCKIERVMFFNIKGAGVYNLQGFRESHIKNCRFMGIGNRDTGVGAIHSATTVARNNNNLFIRDNIFYRIPTPSINLLGNLAGTTTSPQFSDIYISGNLLHNQRLEESDNTFGQAVEAEDTDTVYIEHSSGIIITGNRITSVHPDYSGIKLVNSVDYESRHTEISGNKISGDVGRSVYIPFTSGSTLPISRELNSSSTTHIDSISLRKAAVSYLDTCDTDGSTGVITGIASTSSLLAGDYVTVSAGFPSVPIQVLTVDSSFQITVNVSSNSAQSGVDLYKVPLSTTVVNPYIGVDIATLSGQTTGNSGVLQQIDYTSGTWVGGNAVGTFRLKACTGAFNASELVDNDTTAATNIATTNGATTGVLYPGSGNLVDISEHRVLIFTNNTIGVNDAERPNSDLTVTRTNVAAMQITIFGNVTVNQPLDFVLDTYEGFVEISGVIQQRLETAGHFCLGAIADYTLVSGEVTPLVPRVRLTSAGGVTDNFDGFALSGLKDGDIFIVSALPTHTITARDGFTKLSLNGNAILVGSSDDRLMLIYDEPNSMLVELSRVIH
jgi:hypothetical protein